jgi:hypothetical protein
VICGGIGGKSGKKRQHPLAVFAYWDGRDEGGEDARAGTETRDARNHDDHLSGRWDASAPPTPQGYYRTLILITQGGRRQRGMADEGASKRKSALAEPYYKHAQHQSSSGDNKGHLCYTGGEGEGDGDATAEAARRIRRSRVTSSREIGRYGRAITSRMPVFEIRTGRRSRCATTFPQASARYWRPILPHPLRIVPHKLERRRRWT